MTIGNKIAGGFALAMGFMAIMGLLFYSSTNQLIATNAMVNHTHQVLETLEKIVSQLKDVETGQRGFLLTQDPDFLDPYHKAQLSLVNSREHLRQLIEDHKEQKKLFAELESLIAMRMEYTRNTIQWKDAGKDKEKLRDAAIALEKTGAGKKIMDDLRNKIHEMQVTEEELLRTRRDDAQNSIQLTMTVITLGTVFSVILIALVGYLLISSINSTVYNGVSQLTSASAQILSTTNQQAAGAQEQAAAVTQTMTTIDQVTQTAEQSALRAKSVGESVQRTLEVGRAGRKVVDDSLVAMESVQEKVETTAENILKLAEQAQAISEIITTVNDIAEQTNLLALNAAIEASRAGEHGKGFTVVAGEVKALADQSKKATAQVRQILGEIQKATNTAVLSTEEVTRGVSSAIKVGGQAGETIKALADTLADVSRSATQIVASIGQQATGMNQINLAMKNIDQVAKQNSSATKQATQAAENLNKLGLRLGAFIGK